ncbi:MAG: hypothetical protein BZY79_01705 [SAR202 cluster bacterium Casp-Chloro-G4]|nr:hypothetical protein [Chloroflexota bacterium]MDA1227095.1 hypothetical protein [Chloroflexota bacterium]PKB61831.1 MAG: hypothetical protein BZY79_01705 [SAR202 cluster bacterium Casp-Chloro-G4]
MAIPQFNYTEAILVIKPLFLFVMAISLYAIFVFKFYRFLSRRDILQLNLDKHNHSRLRFIRRATSFVLYCGKFLIVFPILAFFWFLVLTVLLTMMAKGQGLDGILLVSMAVVGSIRVASYYNEALSTDLAKILPFALLGILLIDSSIVSVSGSLANLNAALARWETMLYYLVAIVLLEFVLRMVSTIFFNLSVLAARAELEKADRARAHSFLAQD